MDNNQRSKKWRSLITRLKLIKRDDETQRQANYGRMTESEVNVPSRDKCWITEWLLVRHAGIDPEVTSL